MTKTELETKLAEVKNETKTALETLFNELNNGQQKKIIKNETVKALFDRYGVTYE